MHSKIKDNTIIDDEHLRNGVIQALHNIKISDLKDNNFIIFPEECSLNNLDENQFIFKSSGRGITTTNIVGYFSSNDDKLDIYSRFSENSENDFFIRYMIETISGYTIHSDILDANKSDGLNLLHYIFPYFLDSALSKGLYKNYEKIKKNNSNFKGLIDLPRHLNSNIPFNGNISYVVREQVYDNSINQLIRHTIEKLNKDYSTLLNSNKSILLYKKIRSITPSYNFFDRNNIINDNKNKIFNHPYFHEYKSLQKLCLAILNEDYTFYGNQHSEVFGLIIDVSWLWEEYIWTLVEQIKVNTSFIHSNNRLQENGVKIFIDRQSKVYPDFYTSDFVLDTKYKRSRNDNRNINSNDRLQLIAYTHILKSKKSGLIFPSEVTNETILVGELENNSKLFKKFFKVPTDCNNYLAFKKSIRISEKDFIQSLQKYLLTSI